MVLFFFVTGAHTHITTHLIRIRLNIKKNYMLNYLEGGTYATESKEKPIPYVYEPQSSLASHLDKHLVTYSESRTGSQLWCPSNELHTTRIVFIIVIYFSYIFLNNRGRLAPSHWLLVRGSAFSRRVPWL